MLCLAVFPALSVHVRFLPHFSKGGRKHPGIVSTAVFATDFFFSLPFTLGGGGCRTEQIDPSHFVSFAACDHDRLKTERETR